MRPTAPVSTAERTILVAGAIGLVIASATWFDAATSSPRSWAGSPLFAYGAIVGLVVPIVVVLLGVLGRRPVALFGASWPRVHLAAAGFALANTVALVVVSSPGATGSVLVALSAVGIGAGGAQLHREGRPAR